MIQIQRAEQFTRAAERLQNERMSVRRAEAHLYEVTNKSKGVRYHVRFTRRDGSLFASCTCPAGLRHGRQPLVCKHLAAAIIYLRAIRDMRRRAKLPGPTKLQPRQDGTAEESRRHA
jgi:uncharacterized Zn finger protein